MGFGTREAREAQQSDREHVRRTVEEIENDAQSAASAATGQAAAAPQSRPSAASFFVKRPAQDTATPSNSNTRPQSAATGRPTAFNQPQASRPNTVPAGRPQAAFGGSAPPAAPAQAGAARAGGFRAPASAPGQSPATSVPIAPPRGLQQLRLDRLIEEVAKVRGIKASALEEMIAKANAQPQAARAAFEKAYREEVLPLRENMVRDMASARSQNPDAVVFLLSDPQNKKSRVIVLDQAEARTKGLNLLDNATLVCQSADYTPFARPADVFGEGRGLSDDAAQQEARRSPRP